MKKLIILLLFIFSAPVFSQLIQSGEELIFSFKLKSGKSAVLLKGENESYLVYRFGTNKKIELEYPAELNVASWQNFTYSYYFRGGGKENAGLDLNYVTFENNGFTYKLYDEYSAEDESRNTGVLVTDTEGKERDITGTKGSAKGSLIDLRYNEKIKNGQ
ncbi:MAG: hypothetical protein IAE90_09445 [Ignavibacteria bacterium]|nr:hypothetical protein [Ignavibacteria bacterium]